MLLANRFRNPWQQLAIFEALELDRMMRQADVALSPDRIDHTLRQRMHFRRRHDHERLHLVRVLTLA